MSVPLFSSSDQVARCLKVRKADILERWDKAARHELEPARHQSKPALYDELPEFLDCVADGIEDGHESIHLKKAKIRKADTHGIERAKQPDYTLEQMLFEYHLLRDAVFEELEEEVRICAKDRGYIHASIDEAMRYAAQTFSEFRIAQEQEGTLRLEMERDLRERFVATLTHDLRTPLTAISATAQLMLRQADLSESGVRLMSRILSNVERTDRMIRDLLDANLIQAGGALPLQIEAADIEAVVREAIDEISSIYGDRMTLKSEGPIPGFWCAKSIRRSVENLLQNAIKYGDVHRKIDVRLVRSETEVAIAVHNFGNPIPETERDTLFRQFRRSEMAHASGKRGWGLGLTLVRGVAEGHGGSVTVESNAETGTTFVMKLPIDARKTA